MSNWLGIGSPDKIENMMLELSIDDEDENDGDFENDDDEENSRQIEIDEPIDSYRRRNFEIIRETALRNVDVDDHDDSIRKYIEKRLQRTVPMDFTTRRDAEEKLWTLSNEDRWRLYRTWIDKNNRKCQSELREILEKRRNYEKKIS